MNSRAPGGYLPSFEVLRLTGIRNVKTLTRWYKAGIIPEPVIGTHPEGRGKAAYYPTWVVAKILAVRNFLATGYGLRAAADLADRQSFEAAVDQSVKIGDLDLKARDVFIARVLEAAKAIIGDSGIPALRDRLLAAQPDIYRQVIEKVHNGENPVLVVSPYDCAVTPDYALSVGLSEVKIQSAARAPLLVVPLALLLEQDDVSIGWRRPFDYTITPVNRVRFASRRGEVEREIEREDVPDSYWRGFTMKIPVRAQRTKERTSKRVKRDKRKG